MSRLVAAVDLGGTKVALAIAAGPGNLLAQHQFPTDPARGPEAVLGEIATGLRDLAAGHGPLAAIGVASVGPLVDGVLMNPPNFPGWAHVPLRDHLVTALGAPVIVDNDANAAALAEFQVGAGRGARDLLYATISTGIGGGLVLDGALRRGFAGAAGELGHQTLDPGGPLCGCGNRGCFETLASGPAILRAARAWGLDYAQASDVANAVDDAGAVAVWTAAVEWLAIGLGNAVSIVAVDRVVLGGGVALGAGNRLLVPLRAALARRVRMLPVDKVDVRLAELGASAGLHGAIALALASPG